MLQVYTTTWWMMAYGSPTPKRLQGRSNWRHVVELNTGKLARTTMEELTQFKTASGLDATPCNVLWTPRYMHYLCANKARREGNGLETKISKGHSTLNASLNFEITNTCIHYFLCFFMCFVFVCNFSKGISASFWIPATWHLESGTWRTTAVFEDCSNDF